MINEVIAQRQSTVLFSSRMIDENILLDLFEAARWAPSSRNAQPWRFIIGMKGDEYFNALLSCLDETNQIWASNAPILILTVAQEISDYNKKPNIYAWHDTAMAYSNLVFQAVSMGLSIHPMGGFDRVKVSIAASIPEGYAPVAFAALGYKSKSNNFAAVLVEREKRVRERKPLAEIVFNGRFGNKLKVGG